jgi:hypothetical protein
MGLRIMIQDAYEQWVETLGDEAVLTYLKIHLQRLKAQKCFIVSGFTI